MGKKKALGLSTAVLLLALYLVQHPIYSADRLKKELQDKVVVICGASSGK
jgi:hypothetical protein